MVKLYKTLILLFMFTVLVTTGSAFEKVGTTSFQFLKVMNDARSTALGESYSSVVNNADAMFWNPAGLSKIKNTFDLSISHTNWFMDTKHFSIAAAFRLGRSGTLGISGILVDMGEVYETRVEDLGFTSDGIYNPGLTGNTLNIGAQVFSIGYGKMLTDKFSFGLAAKHATEDLYYEKKSNINFDLGLFYKTGYRSIKIAAVIRHFGPEIKYYDRSYPLPQTFNIGFSADIIGPDESILMTTKNQRLMFTFDLIHPRDYDQQYGVGIEYSLWNTLCLRTGYKINYDEEGLTLGFGLNLKNYRIDYSYNDYGDHLGYINRFSFGFLFK